MTRPRTRLREPKTRLADADCELGFCHERDASLHGRCVTPIRSTVV